MTLYMNRKVSKIMTDKSKKSKWYLSQYRTLITGQVIKGAGRMPWH